MNSNAKFRGLARRGFPATKKKIKNPGVDLRPPSVRGLKVLLVGEGGGESSPGGFSYLYQKPFALGP